MTNEEILKKAIEKAVKGGFKGSFDYCGIYCEMACDESGGNCVYTTIFNHEFAKAFWGEGEAEEQYDEIDKYWHDTSCCSGSGVFFRGRRWQYHLQQMVLEEEPLKYLKKFL